MNEQPDELGQRLRKSIDHGTAPELPQELVTGASARTAPKLTNPRARLQAAGAGVVLVAAVAVAALVVVPSLSSAPLFTAAAGSASASGGVASANVPAVNDLMRIWAEYRYHAGKGLSTASGNGHVYQLLRTGTGAKRAAALDTIFGLGDAAATEDDSDASNPVWTTGTVDGSTPSLEVTWSGTGDWWYNDPGAYPQAACPPSDGANGSGSSTGSSGAVPPAVTDPGDPVICPDGTSPTGPDKAPTGAAARAAAQALLAKTGFDVPAGDIHLTSDSTQTTATAYLTVGGVETALDWGVTWSSTGAIASAYGHSVTVSDRGSHSTVSPADAVGRLSDSRWSGSTGPKYDSGVRAFSAVGSAVGSAAGPVPDTVTPTDAPTASPTDAPTTLPTAPPTDTPTDSPTAQPTPTAVPTPQPSPTGPPIIDVTINVADPTLLLLWDSHGNGWLVPGFAMKLEGGWWNGVVSLAPGVIALPPVPSVEPDGVAPATP